MPLDPNTRLDALVPGQRLLRYARPGDQVICLEGSIHLSEQAISAEWQGLSVVLRGGESHFFHEGGLVVCQGAASGLVLYLSTQPVWQRYLSDAVQTISKWCMIRFIRRGVEQSGSSSGS